MELAPFLRFSYDLFAFVSPREMSLHTYYWAWASCDGSFSRGIIKTCIALFLNKCYDVDLSPKAVQQNQICIEQFWLLWSFSKCNTRGLLLLNFVLSLASVYIHHCWSCINVWRLWACGDTRCASCFTQTCKRIVNRSLTHLNCLNEELQTN